MVISPELRCLKILSWEEKDKLTDEQIISRKPAHLFQNLRFYKRKWNYSLVNTILITA